MKKLSYDLVIIGGGPAGLAAALEARRNNVEKILVCERGSKLGGILEQCIHNGFGLQYFKEELTGPEYATRFAKKVLASDIDVKTDTMVLDITEDKKIIAQNGVDGLFEVETKACILAMGCRERPRGALNIPGYRPAGIYNAGTAQRLVNIEGYMPGKEVVILGSGDIGLIMARRLTLEGAKVKLVAELMPYSGGLKRNIVQCLDDYDIPLRLSHTVVDIQGRERVEGVTIAQVDEHLCPIPGTEETYSCDTLLLSVGLIPENELSEKMDISLNKKTNGPLVNECLETSIEGVFACGNVLHVHDLVDFVSEEAGLAGKYAAQYINHKASPEKEEEKIILTPGEGINYTVPNYINPNRMEEKVKIRFRVKKIYEKSAIAVYLDGEKISTRKKRVFAPGEMEEILLKKQDVFDKKNAQKEHTLVIKMEEEG